MCDTTVLDEKQPEETLNAEQLQRLLVSINRSAEFKSIKLRQIIGVSESLELCNRSIGYLTEFSAADLTIASFWIAVNTQPLGVVKDKKVGGIDYYKVVTNVQTWEVIVALQANSKISRTLDIGEIEVNVLIYKTKKPETINANALASAWLHMYLIKPYKKHQAEIFYKQHKLLGKKLASVISPKNNSLRRFSEEAELKYPPYFLREKKAIIEHKKEETQNDE